MNQRDLLVRIDSDFNDKGFKSAEASAKAMVRELDRQEKAVRDLGHLQMAAQRENEARQAAQMAGLQKVGRATTAMGLVVAAGMGLAAKSAMDWETAWTGVTKTVSGSAEQMGELETQLRALAKVLPSTHEEIAGVAEAAGQLGIHREDIAAFTKTMIDLGVSTNLTADEAATGIAQISNVMGTLQREGTAGVSKFGATLVALGNAGASTEADILEMAQRLAGAGKLVGASESDVLALANAMSSVGIEAELGGGAIQRTFLKIYAATRDGGDALNGFAKVAGMSAQQFAQQWSADPVRAFDAFIQGLDKVDKSGGNAVKTLGDVGISGTQNLQVLLRLKGAGDLLSQSLDLGNKSWAENLALVQEANKRYETAASRIAIARNNLNDAAIDIGGTVLPALAGAADRVGFLASAFQSLPGPVKEGVSALGGTVAALGTIGGLALLAIPKLKAMTDTLAGIGPKGAAAAKGLGAVGSTLMGPWGLALGAATIAIGIFAEKQFEAKKRSDELKATLDQTTGAITDQTLAMLAQSLQQDGLIDRAKEAGVSSELLLRAYSGETDALDQLQRMQKAAAEKSTELAMRTGEVEKAFGLAGTTTTDWTGSSDDATAAAAAQNAALLQLLGVVRPMNTELNGLKTKTAETGEAASAAAGPTGDLTTGFTKSGDAASTAATEIDKLTKAVLDYGETVANQRDKNRALEGSFDNAADSLKGQRDDLVAGRLKKQGIDKDKLVAGRLKGDKDVTADDRKAAEKWAAGKIKEATAEATKWADAQIAAGKGLDIHTEAGRKNQAALDDIAKAAKDAAVANFDNGMSVKDVTDKMMTARGDFVDMATKMGMSKKEANKLADQLGLTRQNVDTLSQAVENVPTAHATKFDVETEAALTRLKAFQTAIDKLHGKTVTAGVRYAYEGRLPNGGVSTKGGSTFGDGGYTGDIPRTEPAGTVHGREFVSDANTTAQWRGLLEHMHKGGDPRAYFSTAPAAPSAASSVTNYNTRSTKYLQPITIQRAEIASLEDLIGQAASLERDRNIGGGL